MKDFVTAHWKSNMSFTVSSAEGNLELGASKNVGGDDDGLRSKSLMLSSLAGCTGMDLASLMKKMHVQVDEMSIEVVGTLTEEHPKIYSSTHIIYTFKGSELDKAKLEKIIDLSVNKYCGVLAMFKAFSTVTFEIIYS